jgi:hypothetical protein
MDRDGEAKRERMLGPAGMVLQENARKLSGLQ